MIKEKNTIKKLIISIIFFIIFICINNKVSATTISFSPTNPKVGDTVTVTVSISNVNTATITANVSGVATGTIKVVGGNLTKEPSSYSNSGTFKCTQEGNLNVSISSDSSAVLNGNYVDVVTSASVKVSAASTTVETPVSGTSGETPSTPSTTNTPSSSTTSETPSSNANLANLGIRPNDFTGFRPEKLEYTAKVPNNVTSVQVYAAVKASGAKYSVSGNYNNLQVGTNKISVTVTAPDGKTRKTYVIYVAREAGEDDEEIVPNVIEEETEGGEETLGLKSIAIDDQYDIYLEPEFKPDIYKYTINLEEDLTSIPLNAIPNRENAKVEIIGNEDLKDGKNTIRIIVTDEETGETAEYIITVNKGLEQQVAEDSEKEETQYDKANKMRMILRIGVISAVLVAIVASVIIIIIRKRREEDLYNNTDYDDYDDEYYKEDRSTYYITDENKDYSEQEENIEEEPQKDIKKPKGKHF